MTESNITAIAERFEAMTDTARQAVAELAAFKATTGGTSDAEYAAPSDGRRLLEAVDALGAVFGTPDLGSRLV